VAALSDVRARRRWNVAPAGVQLDAPRPENRFDELPVAKFVRSVAVRRKRHIDLAQHHAVEDPQQSTVACGVSPHGLRMCLLPRILRMR